MKKYIIKDVLFDKENEADISTYYVGRDGHVHVIKECAEGWLRARFAINYIKQEREYSYHTNFVQIDNETFSYIESGRWIHLVRVIEVEV